MRTFFYSALAVATLGFLSLSPASAAAYWECMGGPLACSGSPAAFSAAAYNTRSRSHVYASRGERRHASGSYERRASSRYARPYRVAARTERHHNTNAASFSRAAYSGSSFSGMASYYGSESGSCTASGAHFNPSAMTAAHRSLPFGTKVRVTNRRNGRSVIVTINDRGPFVRGRVIDLSSGAAGVIGMRGAGVAPVSLEVLGRS
jgi:peptidoglycan lytic transglycosylase